MVNGKWTLKNIYVTKYSILAWHNFEIRLFSLKRKIISVMFFISYKNIKIRKALLDWMCQRKKWSVRLLNIRIMCMIDFTMLKLQLSWSIWFKHYFRALRQSPFYSPWSFPAKWWYKFSLSLYFKFFNFWCQFGLYGSFRGLNIVLGCWDCHNSIHNKILLQNDGLTFLLAHVLHFFDFWLQ